ncbi:chaperonin GroES [Mesorhizobium robiniae]|uniref:Co-chaperonin GroES n=1 Tax=Mesorhizobium robiniae TaxID=559315 RepID=A0ABV2GV36_9HYPH
MKFRPLHDRVVIRRAESDTKSKGGIIIPDNAKEKPQEGEVIAVGPGARDESGALIALDVKAGDLILFGKWSGTEVKIDGEDLLIMKEADIMGIIDKSEMGIIDKGEMGIIDKSEMGVIEKTVAVKAA